ncbi:MAG: glycosyltransferase, partial [Paucimonas sp.]|nr:glycosyltransferase [Paucimonas sp.]
LYFSARLFDGGNFKDAIGIGSILGLLALTRGFVVPAVLWAAILALSLHEGKKKLLGQVLAICAPIAVLIVGVWSLLGAWFRPYEGTPFDAWMVWNYNQLGAPTWHSVKYFFKNAVWFAWPAWPFAGWAVFAWRRQGVSLHIVLPLAMLVGLIVAAILNPAVDQGMLLPMLPPLAILAAFGLPTMKRGAINAVDWFSVMTLTTCAAFIWMGWIAKQSGWPAQLAKNAFKLAPGFKPEFNWIAFVVAAAATIGWIMVVRWRISRRPSVLWRAVVLSSGGVILCWLLLMTLWLPWINYGKSYAGVARELSTQVSQQHGCVEAAVGPAQRASFAYFGNIRFSGFNERACEYFLEQTNNRNKRKPKLIERNGSTWRLVWEGHRPSDRHERYRLYRRLNSTS